MGEIRINGSTVATFENGTVYEGGFTWGDVLGYYGGGKIENKYHELVAKYSSGTAYDLDTFSFGTQGWISGSALFHCAMSSIYEGGSSWNNWVGSYSGDIDGACAAVALYYIKYDQKNAVENHQDTQMCEGQYSHIDVGTGEPGSQSSGWSEFWGILIFSVICLGEMIFLYFTDSGRELLFGETVGIFLFGACILSAVIGGYKVYRQQCVETLKEIADKSVAWYGIACVLVWVIGVVDTLAVGATFWNVLLLIILWPIGAVIVVVAVAAPIYAMQVVAVYFLKHKRLW